MLGNLSEELWEKGEVVLLGECKSPFVLFCSIKNYQEGYRKPSFF